MEVQRLEKYRPVQQRCVEVLDLAPAHDWSAERAVLGALVLRGSAPEGGLPLRADEFYDDQHRKLWRAIEQLTAAGKPCGDPTLLLAELKKDKTAYAHPEQFIVEIARAVPTAVHLPHYADIVRGHAHRRGLRRLAEDLLLAAAADAPLAEVLQNHRQELESLWDRVAAAEKAGPLLTRFDRIDPRATRWLWPSRIAAGRLTLVVGRPGAGKSYFTCDMAARVSTGTPWPDGGCCPRGDTIFITAEDDPHDTIRPRLDAHWADVARIHLLAAVRRATGRGKVEEVAFTLRDVDALEQALRQVPDCRLVVIDPIGSFLGEKADAHRDNEVRSVLAPVARLAEQYGPAVVVVAHTRKSAAANADDMALGSRAFTGIARGVWHLMRDPKDKHRRLLLAGKSNLAVEQPGLAFTLAGETASVSYEREPVAMNADEALALEAQLAPAPGDDKAVEWLARLLADGPRGAQEVQREAAAAGISRRALRAARKRLEAICGPESYGGPWTWRLPVAPVSTVAPFSPLSAPAEETDPF